MKITFPGKKPLYSPRNKAVISVKKKINSFIDAIMYHKWMLSVQPQPFYGVQLVNKLWLLN
jgi:hypothetical protein